MDDNNGNLGNDRVVNEDAGNDVAADNADDDQNNPRRTRSRSSGSNNNNNQPLPNATSPTRSSRATVGGSRHSRTSTLRSNAAVPLPLPLTQAGDAGLSPLRNHSGDGTTHAKDAVLSMERDDGDDDDHHRDRPLRATPALRLASGGNRHDDTVDVSDDEISRNNLQDGTIEIKDDTIDLAADTSNLSSGQQSLTSDDVSRASGTSSTGIHTIADHPSSSSARGVDSGESSSRSRTSPRVAAEETDVGGTSNVASTSSGSSSSSSRGSKRPLDVENISDDEEEDSAPPRSRQRSQANGGGGGTSFDRSETSTSPPLFGDIPGSSRGHVQGGRSVRGAHSISDSDESSDNELSNASPRRAGGASGRTSSRGVALCPRKKFGLRADSPGNIVGDGNDGGDDDGGDGSPGGGDEVEVVGVQTAIIDVEEEDENRPEVIKSTNSQPIVIDSDDDDDDGDIELIGVSRNTTHNDSSVVFIRESPRRPTHNISDASDDANVQATSSTAGTSSGTTTAAAAATTSASSTDALPRSADDSDSSPTALRRRVTNDPVADSSAPIYRRANSLSDRFATSNAINSVLRDLRSEAERFEAVNSVFRDVHADARAFSASGASTSSTTRVETTIHFRHDAGTGGERLGSLPVLPPPPPPPQPFSPRPPVATASSSSSRWFDGSSSSSSQQQRPSSSSSPFDYLNLAWRPPRSLNGDDEDDMFSTNVHRSHAASSSAPPPSSSVAFSFRGSSLVGDSVSRTSTTVPTAGSSSFSRPPSFWGESSSSSSTAPPQPSVMPFGQPRSSSTSAASSSSSRFHCRCDPPSHVHTDERDCMIDQVFRPTGGASTSSSSGPSSSAPFAAVSAASLSSSNPIRDSRTVGVGSWVVNSNVASVPAPSTAPPSASSSSTAAAPMASTSFDPVGSSSSASVDSSASTPGVSCPICLDSITEIKSDGKILVSTNCGHVFCNVCIKDTIRTQKKCPTCRKKLGAKSYHPIYL